MPMFASSPQSPQKTLSQLIEESNEESKSTNTNTDFLVTVLFEMGYVNQQLVHKKQILESFQRENYEDVVKKSLDILIQIIKSVACENKSKIQSTSEKDLMGKLFNENNPVIKINPNIEPTQKSEQEGFKLILMGLMSKYRNRNSHKPEDREFTKRETINLLFIISECLDVLDNIDDMLLIDICSTDNFTGKKLHQIGISNDKFRVKSFVEAYKITVKQIAENNPEIDVLSRTNQKMRNPFEILDGVWVDIHGSSNSLMKTLQRLSKETNTSIRVNLS